MTYEETLRVQWNKLREEMVELMRFQEKNLGRLDFAELNRVYQSKTLRWSSQMQPEGRWLAEIENDQMKAEFKDALSRLSLTEVTAEKSGGGTMALLVGLGAGVAGAVAGNMLRGVLTAGVLGAAAFAGVFAVMNVKEQSKRTARTSGMEAEYIRQIAQGLESAAAVLRKYD